MPMVSVLVKHTKANASSIKSKNKMIASRDDTAPEASGRCWVRFTWPSSQRSA
jgi:hypothetical protein